VLSRVEASRIVTPTRRSPRLAQQYPFICHFAVGSLLRTIETNVQHIRFIVIVHPKNVCLESAPDEARRDRLGLYSGSPLSCGIGTLFTERTTSTAAILKLIKPPSR